MIILWGLLFVVYIVVGFIWAVVFGTDYSRYEDRKSALMFLGATVWPLIVLFWILRLVFRTIETAIKG